MNFGTTKQQTIPLAIVGVGALFPGSPETGDLWRTIVRGIDRMGDVPPNYFLTEDYYDPDPSAPLKTYARRGAFLPKVPFDSLGHGVPPSTVPMTDASQLLALIVAKRVLEDACGLTLGRLDRARTSVILGVAGGSTLLGSMCASLQRPIWTKALRENGLPESQVQAICAAIEANYTPWTESTFPGLLGNVIAGRVASRFDLGGTNCTVDAACASSLAAIRMAAQELRLGAADLVVTGGVDATNDPMMFTCFSKTPALSRTGDCRPFSADSDGTMLGEGVGMVALRRLHDAERDGDQIYAVIRGLGASSDGRAKSIYAPRAEGQMGALRRAYEDAGYSPAQVELVEAHGTGTAAGDLAEVSALKQVFAEVGDGEVGWCDLGSVKSQIGHTKSAAGAASLYKTTMALHHKVLPPTLKVSRPNPLLDIETSAFQLSSKARPWIHDKARPRRAGVSSFGFGGSNYHMTMEEYVGANRPRRVRVMPSELVLISGRDAQSAIDMARKLLQKAELPDGFALAARTSQIAFDPTACVRLAFVVADAADLASRIEEIAPRLSAGVAVRLPQVSAAFGEARPGPIGFLFPGQGSQYTGMGADLALAFEAARSVWDEAASDPTPGFKKLHRLVFPATAFDAQQSARQEASLTATEVAQPAIGVTSHMMLALVQAAGLRPDAAAGHSFGELSALHAACVLDASGLRKAARHRGELMANAAQTTSGTMLAVFRRAAEVQAVLDSLGLRDMCIANHNAPDQVVLAGTVPAIEAIERHLAQLGHSFKRLPVATAFHSPIVAPAAAPFRALLEALPVHSPRLPIYGCATAAAYGADTDQIRAQLAEQLTKPVRFVEQIEAMYQSGITTFVEIGPGATLTDLAGRILADRPHLALPMDRRGRNGVTQMWETFGALSLAGHRLDLAFAWDHYPDRVPAPDKITPATLMIDGANYRKPYPPVGGAGALPPPNPELEPVTVAAIETDDALPHREPEPDMDEPHPTPLATPASKRDMMTSKPDSNQSSALIEALRLNAEAHATSQKAMALAHVAYLRQTQELISHLTGVSVQGFDLAEVTSALRIDGGAAAIDGAGLEPAPAEAAQMKTVQTASQVEHQTHPAAAVSSPVPPSAPAPAVAPAREPEAIASSPVPTSALAATLLGIVAEKTGYPAEMLNPDMELEADLGIDSIKRVEILAALRSAAPDLPDVDPRDLASLRTLRAILDRLGGVGGEARSAAPAPVPTPAPVVAPTREPEAVASSAVSTSALAATLLGIVAEKTGYPAEMLNPDMELEADLGIDSIKRVEILAALRTAAPDLPDVDPRDLASLRTLRAILDRLGGVGIETSPAPAVITSPLPRIGLSLTPLGSGGEPTLSPGMTVIILGDQAGMAKPLASLLEQSGLRVIAADRIAEASALILLQGLERASDQEAITRLHLEAFAAARAFAPQASQRGGVLILVQDTGGKFALDGAGDQAWLAGMAGIAKTAAAEWPLATVRTIDIDRAGQTPQKVAARLIGELQMGGPIEVGLPADGQRLTISETTLGAPASIGPALPKRAVLVVSGGARGVVASCLLALSAHLQLRLLLLGRTELKPETIGLGHATTTADLTRAVYDIANREGRQLTPRQLSMEVGTIVAAREVRATLAALEAAGAEVRYRSVDVADVRALNDALSEARTAWGSIDGLVHGAGVLADKLIAEQTDEQFLHVFRTKVDGLAALLDATRKDALKRLCFFSSVAGRYGNAGQVAYAAANEVLNKVARREARSRGAACRVLSLNWGPWDGGMVTDGLREDFARRGVPLIDREDGAQAFVAEMLGSDGHNAASTVAPVEVVLGGRLDRSPGRTVGAVVAA